MSNLTGTTWVFNDTITLPSDTTYYAGTGASGFFVCKGIPFIGFYSDDAPMFGGLVYYDMGSGTHKAYNSGIIASWASVTVGSITISNTESKKVTFISEPNSADFVTWLEANATEVDITTRVTYSTCRGELEAIADQIRAKTGNNSLLKFPKDFIAEIGKISTRPYIESAGGFRSTISASEASVTIKQNGSASSSTRYLDPLQSISGKRQILTNVSSFAVFGQSQTVSDFVFVQDLVNSSRVYVYSATGSDITINRPEYTVGDSTLDVYGDLFVVNEP